MASPSSETPSASPRSSWLRCFWRLNEEPAEVGEAALLHSSRGPARRVRYQSNFDLFPGARGQLARDTLFLELPAPEEEIPRGAQCRGAWTGAAYVVVGLPLLPAVPGAAPDIYMLGHPASFLTVLLQGGVGGLQVLVGACLGGALGGRRTPVPGALVVNVGDLLQPPARVQTTGSRAWSTGWWPVATSPTVSLCWSRRPAFSGRPAPPRPPGNPVVLDECILPICHDKGYPLDQR
jgi:hypothetical protein